MPATCLPENSLKNKPDIPVEYLAYYIGERLHSPGISFLHPHAVDFLGVDFIDAKYRSADHLLDNMLFAALGLFQQLDLFSEQLRQLLDVPAAGPDESRGMIALDHYKHLAAVLLALDKIHIKFLFLGNFVYRP